MTHYTETEFDVRQGSAHTNGKALMSHSRTHNTPNTPSTPEDK